MSTAKEQPKSNAKSQVANFEYIARLKFASKLRYMTDHSVEDVMSENYFKNSMNNYLEAGDEIDVVLIHDDGTWTKFLLEVTKKTATEIVVEFLTKPTQVEGVTGRKLVKKYEPSQRKWTVRTEGGDVVAKGLTKAEAEKLVEDELAEAA